VRRIWHTTCRGWCNEDRAGTEALKRGEGPYTLSHRYGDKKLIGSHRTLRSLERGIVRYHDQELVKMGVRL
jgi:hypothetical protein